MKFPAENFFSKCEQICQKLGIWWYLLERLFNGKIIFCAVV